MSWLKFDTATPEKPEVMAITLALGFDDPDLTVGKLLKVWRWFDQHTTDGNAASVSAALLDRVIGVSGMCAAMASVGWMVIDDDGLRLPGFDRHNGQTAKKRALTAQRVAKASEKRKTNAQANDETNARSVSAALPRERIREEDITPHTPLSGESGVTQGRRLRRKSEAMTFAAWLQQVKSAGQQAIAEDDPIFAYATKAGLPVDFLRLAWVEFRRRYVERADKRQSDWPRVFRNCVRGNWLRLWYATDDGGYALTTAGQQAQRADAEGVPA